MSMLELVGMALFALATTPQETTNAAAPNELSLNAIDAAVERGATWLRAREQSAGSFAPASEEGACPVALTAMALWSLSDARPGALDDAQTQAAVRYLVAHHREDGGIYDPARGLAVYTTGVAVRALRSVGNRSNDPALAALVSGAELFVYRRAAPESILDVVQQGEVAVAKSAEVARTLLDKGDELTADKRQALEFLANAKRDGVRTPARVRVSGQRGTQSGMGPFTYDDLLPFVYLDLSPDHTVAVRALEAVRSCYAVDRNPDLTRRYGPAGFQPGSQGLFYYYLVVARALSTHGIAVIETADGVRHEWAREIATRLLQMQRADGSWVNDDKRWWEHEPVLVTSYALLTLARCRATLAANPSAR